MSNEPEIDLDAFFRKLEAERGPRSPESQAKFDEHAERLRRAEATGVWAPSRPGNNFAIGFDDNMNKFPVPGEPPAKKSIPPATAFRWPTREDNLRAQAEAERRMNP
jgi:hypothetical protein